MPEPSISDTPKGNTEDPSTDKDKGGQAIPQSRSPRSNDRPKTPAKRPRSSSLDSLGGGHLP